MSLILLRHTRPDRAEGLCYGRTDLSLAEGFEAEAARLARSLPPVRRILTSPLSRCAHLARAIGAARGLRVETEPRIIEMDFGRWEGTAWSAIPRDELDRWRDDLLGANPHGGERVADLAARTRAALGDAAAGPVPALIVTHHGVIKAALAARGDAAAWRTETPFGGWHRLEWPDPGPEQNGA